MSPKEKITREELQNAIEEVDNCPLNLNDEWYVVAMKWWKQLTLALNKGFVEDVPKIENASVSEMKDGHYFLKPHLVEKLDYMLLPQKTFNLLLNEFGVEDENRDVIQRKVQLNPVRGDLFIEVYAKFLTVALARDRNVKAVLPVSMEDNVKTLSAKAVQALGVEKIPHNRLRFYIYHQENDRYELLTLDMKHSYEHFFSFNQLVLVDVLDDKGVGFIQQSLNRSNGSSINGSSSYSRLPSQIPGVCGLQNLGNTCFMASAIQCLSNKPYNEEEENTANKPEDELAQLQWEQYKARNDSIIVDKVHGQIKSTLICPICQKVSIKFDPICFLSLPLPPREKIEHRNFIVIQDPPKKWAQFSMKIKPQKTTVADATVVILGNFGLREDDSKIIMYTFDSYDNVKVLKCEDYVYPERISTFPSLSPIYASIVDPSCQSFVVVKNQSANGNRSLSVPLVLGLSDSYQVNQNWIDTVALPYVKRQFFKENLIDEDKEALQYEVLVEKDGAFVPFTEETNGISSLTIRWQTSQHFNQKTGKTEVERECSVPIPTDIHLKDCIDLFTKEEQYCPRCKVHQRAMKKLDLWKLPEILIIHLKRFNYTRWNREKIDIQVEIPVRGFELNDKLANTLHEHVQYDLIAMSHHSGGLGGGHYTASAINPNGKWYEFNDSCVSERNPPADRLKASSPYMLVYRRRHHVKADEHIEMETDE
ncbi:unnamed protein product, partial [Mesorhabditis belari]|uniref:Ubiquitin carboxyl-terminal hydrolase n=1 Tax=Mesorhabditis belari TaxID=2138241 RepID=A0AAF3FFZ2_9BILA